MRGTDEATWQLLICWEMRESPGEMLSNALALLRLALRDDVERFRNNRDEDAGTAVAPLPGELLRYRSTGGPLHCPPAKIVAGWVYRASASGSRRTHHPAFSPCCSGRLGTLNPGFQRGGCVTWAGVMRPQHVTAVPGKELPSNGRFLLQTEKGRGGRPKRATSCKGKEAIGTFNWLSFWLSQQTGAGGKVSMGGHSGHVGPRPAPCCVRSRDPFRASASPARSHPSAQQRPTHWHWRRRDAPLRKPVW